MKDYTKIVKGFTISGNAWLHRNNHNGEAAWRVLGFDENGRFTDPTGTGRYYISVGCGSRNLLAESYLAIARSYEEDARQGWKEFERICMEKLYKGEKPRYRYALWRFLFEFRKGDILLVPGNHKDFHVFRLVSAEPVMRYEIEEQYSEIKADKEHDFHYFWEAEPIRVNMENQLLADQTLSSRMKFRGTTSWLDDALRRSLEWALASERLSLHADAQEGLCRALLEAINLDCNDMKFEKLIKWYFLKIGASSAVILPKKDEGAQDADVTAVFEALRVKIYVQAKKHEKNPKIEHAREQIKAYKEKYHTEDDGYTYLYWVIHASAEEPKFEDETDEIRLISGIEFAGMLLDAGISGIDEAFYGKED